MKQRIAIVIFIIARPFSWVGDRLYRLGRFTRDAEFSLHRFTCAYCGKRQRELTARRISYWSNESPRICRKCDESIPF